MVYNDLMIRYISVHNYNKRDIEYAIETLQKHGNEKTKLRNLNPLPHHMTYFINEIDGVADSQKRKQGFALVTDSMLCMRVAAFLCDFWVEL